MKRTIAWVAGAALTAMAVASAQAPMARALPDEEGTYTGEGYYEGKDEGWFWKVRDPVEPAPEIVPEVAPEPEPVPEPPEVDTAPPPVSPTRPSAPAVPEEPAGPKPLSAEWLREALPKYQDRAMNNPTTENVAAFFYLQRYAVDMAERFALQAQRVVMSDPVLDENSRRPQSVFGADVVDRQAEEAADRVLEVIADEAGLWYFYRSDCPYCAAQSPVLENMVRKTDIAIMAIALDNAPLIDGHFPDWVPNGGQAEMLEVRATPTLYLVRPPGEFLLIAEGVMAETMIRERIIQQAHQAGWISDALYHPTRRVNQIHLAGTPDALTDAHLDDPIRLVELLRASVSQGLALP